MVRSACEEYHTFLDRVVGTHYPLPTVIGFFIGYHIVRWVHLRRLAFRVSRHKSRRNHFQTSIQMVSEEVRNSSLDENDENQSEVVLSAIITPQSGYFDCSFREIELYDKKSSQTFLGPTSDPGTTRHFQNKLNFNEGGSPANDESNEIRFISGTRSAPGDGHFTIEQGFVATATGAAYWVEISNEVCYLVRGTFQHVESGGHFSGEWLSSDGARGSYDLEPQNRSLPLTEDNVTVAAIGIPVV